MLEPKFKLIPLANYRHPYQVEKVSYMETGDSRFTYAVISLIPTNKNIKNTKYFIRVLMMNELLKSEVEFNIASGLFTSFIHPVSCHGFNEMFIVQFVVPTSAKWVHQAEIVLLTII